MKNILIILSSLVLSASAFAVNNIKLEGNSITTHNLGGDINLVTTGSGSVRSPGPVGIGDRPDLSALFQVTSQSKGAVCSPVMTTAQRDAIASPVKGLQVFNSTTNEPNFYTGSAWSASGGGGGGADTALSNLASPTLIDQNLTSAPGHDLILETPYQSGSYVSNSVTIKTANTTDDGALAGDINLIVGTDTFYDSGYIRIQPHEGFSCGGVGGDCLLKSNSNTGAVQWTDPVIGTQRYTAHAVIDYNISVLAPGTSTFDGVTLVPGSDLVLLVGQNDPVENGVYYQQDINGAFNRPTSWYQLKIKHGAITIIDSNAGGTYDGTVWQVKTDGDNFEQTTSLVGTDPITPVIIASGPLYVYGDAYRFIDILQRRLIGVVQKLDLDVQVNDADYESVIGAVPMVGDGLIAPVERLQTRLTTLAQKLDLDITVNGTNYDSEIISVPLVGTGLMSQLVRIKKQYLLIFKKLDLDTGVSDADYEATINAIL